MIFEKVTKYSKLERLEDFWWDWKIPCFISQLLKFLVKIISEGKKMRKNRFFDFFFVSSPSGLHGRNSPPFPSQPSTGWCTFSRWKDLSRLPCVPLLMFAEQGTARGCFTTLCQRKSHRAIARFASLERAWWYNATAETFAMAFQSAGHVRVINAITYKLRRELEPHDDLYREPAGIPFTPPRPFSPLGPRRSPLASRSTRTFFPWPNPSETVNT